MEIKAASVVVIVSALVSCVPTAAWYKQAAGPNYYSVGRASGLLSGFQRAPYIRRAVGEPRAEPRGNSVLGPDFSSPQSFILKSMPICIRDVAPNLQSCELQQDVKGVFRCQAEVLLSLDSLDCAGD